MVWSSKAKSSGRDEKESNGMETGENQTERKTKVEMGGPDLTGYEEDEGVKCSEK